MKVLTEKCYSYLNEYLMDYQDKADCYFFDGTEYLCSLELAMTIIGGKWKSMVVYHLKDGVMRSGELQRTIPGISNKMFTQTLRELEQFKVVRRNVYPVVPPKVEYELTDMGMTVLPIVLQLAQWGKDISEKRGG